MSSVVLVPYWLHTEPRTLSLSDHYWWFEPVQSADIIIYAGPFVSNSRWICHLSGNQRLSITTSNLNWRLSDLSCSLSSSGLSLSSVSLIWHVIEATATCRITDLSKYALTSYALIGDTHHLRSPISSLIGYLLKSEYSAIFCTQSHHCFFFSELTNIPVYPFPYVIPTPLVTSHSPSHSEYRLLYTGSILSPHHVERSRVVNYALAHDMLDLVPRMPWRHWLEFLSKDCKRLLSWSLNSNFSPQVMYPLYYGNVLFTDPIAPANWLGELLLENKLCYLVSNASSLVQLVKDLQETSHTTDNLDAESLMIRRSTQLIANNLNVLSDVQEAILNSPSALPELKTFHADACEGIAEIFKYVTRSHGVTSSLRLLRLFEKLQLITSRHSFVYLKVDDISFSADMYKFVRALPVMLTRITLNGTDLFSPHQAIDKSISLSELSI